MQVGGDGTPRARGRHGAPDALHGTRRPGRARGPGRKCVLGHVWGCQSPGGGTDLGHTPLRQHPRPRRVPAVVAGPPSEHSSGAGRGRPGGAGASAPPLWPRRLLWCGGPRAGTGGSGLRAARVGGRRGPGAHIPGCVQCIHEVLVTAGIAEGQLLGAFQALPVLQGAQGKGRRALVCGGAHAGGSVPAAGPGLFVETGLVMKHNLPRPQISDRCFKQNRGQRTRASCRQPEGRTGCPRAVWHPHVTATGATSRCWVCGRQRARLPTCPHTPQLPGGRGDRDRRRPLLKPSPDPRAPSSPNGQDTCPLGVPNPSRPLTTQTADTWTQPTAAPTVT